MKLQAKNFEVRGYEIKESRKTGNEYLVVRVEDETGQRGEFIDRSVDNAQYYTRGTIADFAIEYKTGNYTSLSIVGVTIKNNH